MTPDNFTAWFHQHQRVIALITAMGITPPEYPSTRSKGFAAAWTDRALDTLDDLQIGWAWWQWRDIPTWAIRTPDGSSINMDFLRHVARPFVVAAPEHVDEPVVVFWPALTTPPPNVAGACVSDSRWDSAAARLYLFLQPAEACTIQLTAAA